MAGRRFEDLPVWQSAIRLAEAVYELTGSEVLRGQAALRDQLERASLSVSNNIAEGWERGTQEELLTFLYYARGSCAEVRSMLRFLRGRDRPGFGPEMDRLIALALDTSRQLGAWVESLKNSNGKGPRYRNDKTRQAEQAARRQAEFLEKLRRVQEGKAHTLDDKPPDRPDGP
jgi:four helix bundle protein